MGKLIRKGFDFFLGDYGRDMYVMERRAMTFSILGFIDNLRDTTLHL